MNRVRMQWEVDAGPEEIKRRCVQVRMGRFESGKLDVMGVRVG